MATAAAIRVSAGPSQPRQRGEHWTNDQGTAFVNPYLTVSEPSRWAIAKFVWAVGSEISKDPDVKNHRAVVPQVTMDLTPRAGEEGQIKATWMGHAAFLLEFPRQAGERGIRILCDPAFSDRCSPVQWAGGRKRYTRHFDVLGVKQELSVLAPPCKPEDLPEIDAICLSHNHYDHLDLPTISAIYKKQKERPPPFFAGLNTSYTLSGTVPRDSIIEMDWWEQREVEVNGLGKVEITCAPSQHFCARSATDKDKALWASWAIKGAEGSSVWFAGDTGYCPVTVDHDDIVPDAPVCPSFKQIGDRLGPFSLGLIPIGAYKPRLINSIHHNHPVDAVRMARDVRAKRSIGMHWGVWRMSMDRIAEPVELLPAARKLVGMSDEEFEVLAIGETKAYDP